MVEEPLLLELAHDVADGGRRHAQARPPGDGAAPGGLRRFDVGLDDRFEDVEFPSFSPSGAVMTAIYGVGWGQVKADSQLDRTDRRTDRITETGSIRAMAAHADQRIEPQPALRCKAESANGRLRPAVGDPALALPLVSGRRATVVVRSPRYSSSSRSCVRVEALLGLHRVPGREQPLYQAHSRMFQQRRVPEPQWAEGPSPMNGAGPVRAVVPRPMAVTSRVGYFVVITSRRGERPLRKRYSSAYPFIGGGSPAFAVQRPSGVPASIVRP